jgi:hypothetical protein
VLSDGKSNRSEVIAYKKLTRSSKTGITVRAGGERDEHGMENADIFFSPEKSPEKALPQYSPEAPTNSEAFNENTFITATSTETSGPGHTITTEASMDVATSA